MLYTVISYVLFVTCGFILRIISYTWFYLMSYMLYMVLFYILSVEDFCLVLCKFRRHLSMCLSNVYSETTHYWVCFAILLLINTFHILNPLWLRWFKQSIPFVGPKTKLCNKCEVSVPVLFAVMKSNTKLDNCMNGLIQRLRKIVINMRLQWRKVKMGSGLTFRHRAPCILGQAFHYFPENAFYIFNQQIYFIIWYLLDRASLI